MTQKEKCELRKKELSEYHGSKPKQETLEDASWKHNPLKKLDGEFLRHAFKEGARWQAERMYSEEDLREAFDSAREFNSLDGVVDVHIVLPMGGDMSDLQPLHFTFKEWFEQFKDNQDEKNHN